MAHFARVTGGVVETIVVVNDDVITVNGTETETVGQTFLTDLLGGEWVQCSYNANPVNGVDRGGYPGIGWSWTGTLFEAPAQPDEEEQP